MTRRSGAIISISISRKITSLQLSPGPRRRVSLS
jgi:hypothetical protein